MLALKQPGRLIPVATVLVGLVAALLTAKGLMSAITSSKDFEWGPAKVLLDRQNPYVEFIRGGNELVDAAPPNYLPLLYFVLSPFALLSFGTAKVIWAVLNVAMAISAAIAVGRAASWRGWAAALLVVTFLTSTPFRNVIANGQQTLLILVCAIVAFTLRPAALGGAGLALAITKYSFAPPMVLVLALRRRLSVIGWAVAISVVVAVCFAVVVRSRFLDVLTQPLQVSQKAVGSGVADLMSVVQAAFGLDSTSSVIYVLAIVGCVIFTAASARFVIAADWIDALSIASLISLLCFKHLPYDFCFLLPVVVTGIRASGVRRVVILGAVAYFWYVYRMFAPLGIDSSNVVLCIGSFVILLAAFVAANHRARGATSVDAPSVSEDTSGNQRAIDGAACGALPASH
jgi:hypothetical protein